MVSTGIAQCRCIANIICVRRDCLGEIPGFLVGDSAMELVSFVREILFYFDPMGGFWWLEDNAFGSDCLDVDSSGSFEEQLWDAREYVEAILVLRGIKAYSVVQRGQAWIVTPVENVELARDDSDDSDDSDDFVWLQ